MAGVIFAQPIAGQFIALRELGVGRIVTFGEQWVEVAFDGQESAAYR